MWLTMMNKHMLWALLAIPILCILYAAIVRKKKQEAIKFSSLSIVRQASKKVSRRQTLLFWMALVSIVLLVLALSDPYVPLKTSHKGVNVVLAIDVSGSMQAQDYQPTRLEAAKRAAVILVDNLKANDNIGIVIFESGATTASYMSPFKDRVLEKLKSIQPKEGRTAVGDGLSLAVDMATSVPNKKSLIILLSDGVNNAGVISPLEAVAFAKENGLKVFTVGMGSERPVVLGYDWWGNPQMAELDEETLKMIAVETGGEYYKSVDDDTLDAIYETLSGKIKREKEMAPIKDWFLFSALGVILIELYLRYGRKRVLP